MTEMPNNIPKVKKKVRNVSLFLIIRSPESGTKMPTQSSSKCQSCSFKVRNNTTNVVKQICQHIQYVFNIGYFFNLGFSIPVLFTPNKLHLV